SDYNFNSMDIIRFIFNHKWPILIVTLLAAVISIIVSLQITPKFKSSVVLFPKTQVAVSNALTKAELLEPDDHIMNFGEEEATEQLIQTLYSEEIRFKIIDKFDLLNHYKIDTDGAYPLTRLNKEYDKNIRFKKTEYQAIQIDVLDKDPLIAADIANEISELLDETLNTMQRSIAQGIYKVVTKEYNLLLDEITKIEQSLIKYKNQQQHPKYISYTQQLINANNRLSDMNSKLVEAKVNAEQNLPRKFVVAKAYPAEKKSYPIRWLICVVSTISTFIFAVLVMLFIERYKDLFTFKS
ncbi:MAG: Wzz/FepE/Etk N-terminal domain-containing protein, partial [Bacteroidales bacterium]|nr:Wzz/FepE/Etk N-terminal domain-containing protein [Bacteroidales bacterium]